MSLPNHSLGMGLTTTTSAATTMAMAAAAAATMAPGTTTTVAQTSMQAATMAAQAVQAAQVAQQQQQQPFSGIPPPLLATAVVKEEPGTTAARLSPATIPTVPAMGLGAGAAPPSAPLSMAMPNTAEPTPMLDPNNDYSGMIQQITERANEKPAPTVRKPPIGGKWAKEEDEQLKKIVELHGPKNWKKIAELLGETRTDVQCLHRWNKVLKPGLLKGPWTEEEDTVVTQMVMANGVGNIKWSVIRHLSIHDSPRPHPHPCPHPYSHSYPLSL